MKLNIKKKADGDVVVTLVRDDGSATSGRLGSGGFGAVHDLTHYVVETLLQFRSGFLGLLVKGWNIPDFEKKGTAARLPDEAVVSECIVGQLSTIVFGNQPMSIGDFNWLVSQAVAGVRPDAKPPSISAEKLTDMRQQLFDLLGQWRALPPGQTLELGFTLG